MEVSFKSESPHDFQQFPVTANPAWVGKTIGELRDIHQVVVLAVWREEKFQYKLAANDVIQADDELIAFAPRTNQQVL